MIHPFGEWNHKKGRCAHGRTKNIYTYKKKSSSDLSDVLGSRRIQLLIVFILK
jgi:hypothetical protein